jgi:two-component system response regulator (stage 0 sporulation protein A)
MVLQSSRTQDCEETFMKDTINLLYHLGITPSYRGYRQLVLALELLREDEDLLYQTMNFYTTVAERNHSSCASVERNIRTLATRAWNVNPKLLKRVAGYPLKNKPANAEFLSILLNYSYQKDSNAF